MPTYEYRCQKCQKTFDAVQSMKDERFTVCPENLCQMEGGWGKGEVTRLLGTGAGLIFKGSGFYITDYRSDNYKKGAKQETGAGASSGDSGGGGGKSAAGGEGGGGGGSGSTTPGAPASAPAAGGSGASPAPKAAGSSPPASAPSPKKD